jgi:hypothetical protein
LCHHALQHLVDDTGQDSLIVVGSKCAVNLREGVYPRSGKNTAGDIDHLQVLGASKGGDIARFCADIVVDGCLEPGNVDVGTFGIDFLANTSDTSVLDRTVTTVNCDDS